MKRFSILLFCMMATLACIIVSPIATEQPASLTRTNPPPVHVETNSVMPEITEAVGETQTLSAGVVSVWVYYTIASDENMTPVPVARSVPDSDVPATLVRSTLQELMKGPTDAEKAAGLISWFSPATANDVSGVTGNNNEYTVTFTELDTLIPNASTSAGSQMLLSQLNSTMFQFDFVGSVTYTLEGNCDAFWEWLQSGCYTVTRAEWEAG